jgi:4-amino-4-deoxy-L-arabinose transferase-like glycosyltransferase
MASSHDIDTLETHTRDYFFISVIIIWFLFFLSGFFSIPLIPPDEPKYAFAASKMIETGDFISPTFNCQPRFDKPPLIYWAIAVSYKIFGVSDWAARVPSLLATLGVMLLIYRASKQRFDHWTGVLSVFVFASILHVWIMGRAVAPEMLLVFFEASAIFSFYQGIGKEKKGHLYLGYVFSAFAFLTKGPVGILIPWAIIFFYFSYTKGVFHTARKMLNPFGIILFLVLGLPWYIMMLKIHGYRYFEEFFLVQNIYRFTGKARQHSFHFYYYIPIVLGSLYLWLPFSQEIWMHLKRIFREKSDELLFVFWAAFVLVFFSISSNKLHNYILIAYPPLAILIGTAIRQTRVFKKTVRNIHIGFALAEILILIYVAYFKITTFMPVLLGGCLVIFVSLLTVVKGDLFERTLSLVVAKGLTILLLAGLFLAGRGYQISPAYAFIRHEVISENIPIYFYKDGSEDIVFYANRCISELHSREELREVIQQHSEMVLFVREKHMSELQEFTVGLTVPFNDMRGHKRYILEFERSTSQ